MNLLSFVKRLTNQNLNAFKCASLVIFFCSTFKGFLLHTIFFVHPLVAILPYFSIFILVNLTIFLKMD